MSLADRLAVVTMQRPQQCVTCIWYESLDAEDKAAFDNFVPFAGVTVSVAQFRRECEAEGLTASESSFGRHMREHCGSR